VLDLHCHLLPGVDDGPQTMAEAVALARYAVADGIRAAVLTSHIHPGRYANNRTSLQQTLKAFEAQLAAESIPLKVRLGAEARFSDELLDLLAAGELPFLGEVDGYRILLLEFPHEMLPVGADKLVTLLLRQKIRPLIAHPERNKTVMAKLDRLEPFVRLGCWLQITADSLAGGFGPAAESTAWAIFEAGWNCVLASDGHNLAHRPPRLSAGRDALARRYGREFALDHVIHKPARIAGATVTAVAP